jgi:hypothetical protein
MFELEASGEGEPFGEGVEGLAELEAAQQPLELGRDRRRGGSSARLLPCDGELGLVAGEPAG